MKFSAMLVFIGLWAIFVYSLIAHWVWGQVLFNWPPHAYLNVLDFAAGPWCTSIRYGRPDVPRMLGKRTETGPPHNMVMT
jgi:Amt family ammonium transporter